LRDAEKQRERYKQREERIDNVEVGLLDVEDGQRSEEGSEQADAMTREAASE
jgi:hypothetical protein